MSYTRPAGNAVNFVFPGTAYTRTAGDAANLTFPPASFTGIGAATLELTAAAIGAHGIAGTGAATLDVSAAAAGEHSTIEIVGAGAASLELTAAAVGAHGVAGTGTATLDMAAAAAAVGAHGVAGTGAALLTLTAVAIGLHPRHEIRGEVRQGGVLVNRRVRVYLRDTGALVGQADTVGGRFSIHAGFVPAEHYLVPIDLAESATDWTPPVANRVASVLALDA